MDAQLNEVLHYLESHKNNSVRTKSKYALRLNVTIPSSELDDVIKQLNRDGYINIFMHRIESYGKMTLTRWEERISFELSSRGIHLLKNGGYTNAVHNNIPMNSAVGF
ncbi:MAG: hypothetical protein Crog4KO_24830 [Crocinitomicaceae bacterium]